ncbi:MAG: nicotinamide mononucleotide transporter [Hylemonella sp.]
MTAEELLHTLGTLEALGRSLEQLLGPLLAMHALEALGAATGVLGTALLAFKTRWAGLGFVAYLVSNVALILFFLDHGLNGLLLMQAVFTVFSVVGIWQWLVVPNWERFGAWLDSQVDWGDEA